MSDSLIASNWDAFLDSSVTRKFVSSPDRKSTDARVAFVFQNGYTGVGLNMEVRGWGVNMIDRNGTVVGAYNQIGRARLHPVLVVQV